jgi:hypothetical protein
MGLFENICPHESILMLMGVGLFALIGFAFVWNTVKGKGVLMLLPFFLVPVVMIAYPTVGSIRYSEGKFEFNKLLTEFKNEPLESGSMQDFLSLYDRLESSCRAQGDPGMLNAFAETQLVSGNYTKAGFFAEKSMEVLPNNPEAVRIKTESRNQILLDSTFREKIDRLDITVRQVESSGVASRSNVDAIVKELADINPPANIKKESALVLAKALAIADQKESALVMVQQVMLFPNLNETEKLEASRLQSAIQGGRYVTYEGTLHRHHQESLESNPSLQMETIKKQRLRTGFTSTMLRAE